MTAKELLQAIETNKKANEDLFNVTSQFVRGAKTNEARAKVAAMYYYSLDTQKKVVAAFVAAQEIFE